MKLKKQQQQEFQLKSDEADDGLDEIQNIKTQLQKLENDKILDKTNSILLSKDGISVISSTETLLEVQNILFKTLEELQKRDFKLTSKKEIKENYFG